jgi:hypothetical protein
MSDFYQSFLSAVYAFFLRSEQRGGKAEKTIPYIAYALEQIQNKIVFSEFEEK